MRRRDSVVRGMPVREAASRWLTPAALRAAFTASASALGNWGVSMWSTLVPKWEHVKWANEYQCGYRKCPWWITLVGMVNDNARERSAFSDAVAAQVRAERAARQMTQAALVEASGIPRSTLIRIESGARVADSTQLHRLTLALGLSLSEFFERVESRL